MNIKPQIKALFLLSVFMLMSFHHVIPHSHHDHQKENNEVAHQHHSGEAHHHKQIQKDNRSGFLSYLLAIHSHSGTSHEVPAIKEATEDVRVQKKETKKNFT